MPIGPSSLRPQRGRCVRSGVALQLQRQRSGHLVQMSSVGGVRANPGHSIYAATKFAVEGMSEGLERGRPNLSPEG